MKSHMIVVMVSITMAFLYVLWNVRSTLKNIMLWVFFIFEVFLLTRKFFTHMETLPLPVKGCKFCPMLGTRAIEQWRFFSVPHFCDKEHPFIMVITENPWHSHLLPSVWQWSCNFLFLRLSSVAAGIRIPNLPLAMRTFLPTAPPPRFTKLLTSYEILFESVALLSI